MMENGELKAVVLLNLHNTTGAAPVFHLKQIDCVDVGADCVFLSVASLGFSPDFTLSCEPS